MTKRRPLPSTTSVPGLPRSSTKCGNTACDPSRRRRIDAGAQNAALRSRSLMRAPISSALSCASPFEPGATEDQRGIGSQRGGTPFGVAVESTSRQNQRAVDADLARDALRYQNVAAVTRALGFPDDLRERRARQDVHVATDQRIQQPADQGIAHHEPGAPRPWLTLSRAYRASSLVECSSDLDRCRRRQQMTDIGSVDHHAAKQRELRQRRANQLERLAEQPPVERQRLQRTPGQRRALEFRAIVRMASIGAQLHLGMIFQNFDCFGTGLQEGRAQRSVRHDFRRSAADISRRSPRCRTPRQPMHDACSVSRSIPPTAPTCRRQIRSSRPAASWRLG